MVLLLGPCYNKNDKSKTGGIVVLFENWLNYYSQINEKYILIDTNKSNYKNVVSAYCGIIFELLKYVKNCNVLFLHGTAKDYLFIAPLVVILGKIFGKKIILRKFAGDFKERYLSYNKLFKSLISFVLCNASVLFWETKTLVQFGLNYNKSSYWFPNVRTANNVVLKNIYKKKLVFISQVKKSKGVDEILELSKLLGSDYSIDIYGPIIDLEYTLNYFSNFNVNYKGVIEPENVSSTLIKYDVLILPTYWKGEGYPGIILEALSLSRPVISTYWGGIPEIVKNGYNGFLIEPKDVMALLNAVKQITTDNYGILSNNALESFKDFDAAIVNERINKIVKAHDGSIFNL